VSGFRARCGAVLAATLTLTVVTGTTAGAAPARSLGVKAVAEGLRVTYTVPDFLVAQELMDGGGPVSQAFTDTAGRSVAFASLPYPGENGIAAPGILAVLLGRPVPFSYPLYTNADYPVTPESQIKDPSGVYALQAKAAGDGADSSAAFGAPAGGPPGSGTRTSALTAIADDGSARATAESVNTALSFGDGVLTIASVTSRSATVLAADGSAPKTVTELLIQGATVAGQAVTIGPDGVHPAGAGAVPLAGNPAGAGLAGVLAAAGLSVRTVSSADGAGDVLVVTSTHPLPGSGAQGTLVWRFGGARTAIDAGGAA
jgi:hypothetical protein